MTATGPNSVVGGFAGISFDTISNSTASGAVSGTSSSYLGGFVGINAELIQDSTSSGNVSGSGANNFAGGFAGVNFGNIDPSHVDRQRVVGRQQRRRRFRRRQRGAPVPGRIPDSSA